jgi:hypothetical protein
LGLSPQMKFLGYVVIPFFFQGTAKFSKETATFFISL